ncbi:pimeloyl-ACP methyl ester carboxylesterase [Duganella sp. 1224]|uniref:alpha/beta fold hydrolase n=1 Tax=Duganella sp. 1224 TaxID=2587052 RepID=UPI00182EE84C|nr:alpha/beta hydrolase [Duganella sp. 1224]NYE60980.1 pimeloyl-ACP methyl ester carboxylesterase [Duganella sp. 1224]
MKKHLFQACVALAMLAGAGARAEPPAGQNALAGPQVRVDVGGRKLNLYCTGKGSPTVLFEADAGRAGWDWSAVLPAVAARTRACVYDRAGLGASDPIIRAATVANASKDLSFLVRNTHLEAPFVLVGAGYGALVAQQFTWRARGAVAGLVLVDPLHEDALPADRAARLAGVLACLNAVEQGQTADGCAYPASGINGEIGAALAAAQAAQARKPTYWRARASELDSLDTSAAQVRSARKPFGDLPVVEVAQAQAQAAAITAAVQQLLDKLN